VTRLYACLVAFAGVLLLPFVLRIVIGDPERRLTAPQSRDGALELRIITPHNQDIRRVFEPAFSDWHQQRFGQPVAITYLSPGGTNDIVRYLKDLYGTYRDSTGRLLPEERVRSGIDLIWGGGDYAFERDFKPLLKPLRLAEGVISAAFPQRDLAGVPLIDPDTAEHGPKWVGVVLSSFGIIHAPRFYEVLGLPAPETWNDLARPELAGLVALADPTRSGTAATIYMMVLQRAMAAAEEQWLGQHPELAATGRSQFEEQDSYRAALGAGWKQGMRVLLLMAANARYFTDSASRPCADVGDAESAAGVAIDFYARVFQEQIGKTRITYHAPRGATAITPDPIGILYGTLGEHELVANRFVEFLLSPQAQRLWNLEPGQSPYVLRSLRRLPVRRDVYGDRTGWADKDDPFEVALGFNMRQRWMRQLGRLIPIWAAAWIDTKPSLDRAYRAALAVKEAGLREELLFMLSDLPVEYADVSGPRLAVAGQADPGQGPSDPPLRAARERMQWSERFRRHYEALADRAESSR
jgi:iron(III) transport system substrate-binding protein